MANKLYVGNLPFSFSDEDLRKLFEEVGPVESARVITDRDTGRSKGFGFVEMADSQAAQAAISALNGKDIGRNITVNEARPRDEGGGSRGGRRDGGYSRGYEGRDFRG